MSSHCLFCYEPFTCTKNFRDQKMTMGPCNHSYHWSCYRSWTKFYEDCSYCGGEIKTCTIFVSNGFDFAIREDQLFINGWHDEDTAWVLSWSYSDVKPALPYTHTHTLTTKSQNKTRTHLCGTRIPKKERLWSDSHANPSHTQTFDIFTPNSLQSGKSI